uniref:NADH-ubiquinone oxidoreductase chain 5 n=1 Tax=Anoecia fulviabdominalis TaxID=133068 RepID=A0A1L1YMN3_9HEMI|nr:NADH dehydrogenase subunit 5 [Anoecia fulviabdominalis]
MFFFILGLFFIYFDKFYFIEYMFFYMNSCLIFYVLLIDWMCLMFISFVFLISSVILLYSMEYMNFDMNSNRFLMLMNLFIMFMFFMIISPNMISILMGWDGLGMVSFCLVIFYQNKKSYSSGLVTVLLNRMGDLFIILSLIWMLNYGSWNFIYLNYFMNLDYLFNIILMLMLASLTKSAQIPFSSWLPLAMAALHPVSSQDLRYMSMAPQTSSSAGLQKIYESGASYSCYAITLSDTTVMYRQGSIVNGVLGEKNAFPSCRKEGGASKFLCLGKTKKFFFNLLYHSRFKSSPFFSWGVLILKKNKNPVFGSSGGLKILFPFCEKILMFSLKSLSGFPLFWGFFFKGLNFGNFLKSGLKKNFFFFFLLSFFFTFFYSIRVIYYLLLMNFSMFNYLMIIKFESKFLILSMLIITMIMVFFGSFFMWLFFYKFNLILLEFKFKFLSILILFFSIWFFFELNNFLFSMKYFFSLFYIFFFSFMWNLLFVKVNFFLNNFLFFGFFALKVVEIGWTEYNLNSGIFCLFKNLMISNQNFFLKSYKVYTLVFFLWFLIIFVCNF